jgi:hypothetical protein
VNNQPAQLVDADGMEPIQTQAGSIHGFVQDMNNTPHQVGRARGADAARAPSRLGDTKFPFDPAATAVFNLSPNRWAANGGWLDMVHFVFYAGRAANYRAQGNPNPVGRAVRDGYAQEALDNFKASWSAYSYEDLPSDRYGAIFGAQFFDPTSSLTLGEQIEAGPRRPSCPVAVNV